MTTLRAVTRAGGAIGVAFVIAAAVFFVLGGSDFDTLFGNEPAIALGFPVVGAVVAGRVPRNVIGWLLLGCGLLTASGLLAIEYLHWLGPAGTGRAPLWLVLDAELTWIPGLLVLVTLLPLLFPTGRPPTPRWRVVAIVDTVGIVVTAASIAAGTRTWTDFDLPNPAYTPALRWLGAVGGVLVVAGALSGLGSQVRRYRRSTRVERHQLRWLAWASAVAVVVLAVEVNTDAHSAVSIMAQFLAVLAIPVSIGVAILRYRLYDIDRLVSRTVSYGVATGLLVGVYVGSVALTTGLLPFSSSFGVAASTLAAAGLFRPVRRRVQSVVDRRFNRSRYDTARTVDAFAVRLRDQVDLEAVRGDLLAVIGRTMQPAHASLWPAPLRRART